VTRRRIRDRHVRRVSMCFYFIFKGPILTNDVRFILFLTLKTPRKTIISIWDEEGCYMERCDCPREREEERAAEQVILGAPTIVARYDTNTTYTGRIRTEGGKQHPSA
jgi:hypothetical protein